MQRKRARWSAHWTQCGQEMVHGGDRKVYLQARLDEPDAQKGRLVHIELTPELAHHVAQKLERLASQAKEGRSGFRSERA